MSGITGTRELESAISSALGDEIDVSLEAETVKIEDEDGDILEITPNGAITVADDGNFTISDVDATISVQEDTPLDVSGATVSVTDNGEFIVDDITSVVNVQEDEPLDVSGATITTTDDGQFTISDIDATVSVQEDTALDVSGSVVTTTDDGTFNINSITDAVTVSDDGEFAVTGNVDIDSLPEPVTITEDGTLAVEGDVSIDSLPEPLDVSGATVTVTDSDDFDIRSITDTVTVSDDGEFTVNGSVDVNSIPEPVTITEDGTISIEGDVSVDSLPEPLDVSGATLTTTDDGNFVVSDIDTTISVQEDTPLDVSGATVSVTDDNFSADIGASLDERNIDYSIVSTQDVLGSGESVTLEIEGREMILIQVRNVTQGGDIILETGPDGSEWWPNEELSFSEAGFEQIPWNPDQWLRATSDGFAGEIRIVAGQ